GRRVRLAIHLCRRSGCAGLRRPTLWTEGALSHSSLPSGRLRRPPPPDALEREPAYSYLRTSTGLRLPARRAGTIVARQDRPMVTVMIMRKWGRDRGVSRESAVV